MKIALLISGLHRIGGDVSFCYNVAQELNARIYTNVYEPTITCAYPNIQKYIVLPDFELKNIYGLSQLEHIYRWVTRTDLDADFYIFSGELPAYRTLRDDTPYLYYCHTPTRSLYDLNKQLLASYRAESLIKYIAGRQKWAILKAVDQFLHRVVINPMQVLTNSKITYDRYKKVYGRAPRGVIYSLIDTQNYYYKVPEDYYLTVSRLLQRKRIDWQIKAFSNSNEKLIIVGTGDDKDRLEALARKYNANVEFKGEISNGELKELYARCKAFIFTGIREEFGLVIIDALASGKPVLCVNEGGPLEYLNAQNSILFDSIEELREIIDNTDVEKLVSMKDACLQTAKRYV